MDKTKESELSGFNVTRSLRIDEEMAKKLKNVAIFEKMREGTLLRQWIHEKIRTYYRNPEFKQWVKRLEE